MEFIRFYITTEGYRYGQTFCPPTAVQEDYGDDAKKFIDKTILYFIHNKIYPKLNVAWTI